MQRLRLPVVNALEAFAHTDRPAERHAFDLQLVLDIGEDIQGVHAFAQDVLAEADGNVPAIVADHAAAAALDLAVRSRRQRTVRLLSGVDSQARQQFLAPSQGFRIRARLGVAREFEQARDLVAAGEQQLDQRGVDLDMAVAGAVQGVLHDMGEFDDVVAFDDAGPALDGVGGAEHRVECAAVRRVLFQQQQILIEAGEQLLALRDIGLS